MKRAVSAATNLGQLADMGRLLSLSCNVRWGLSPARKQLCTAQPSGGPASLLAGAAQRPLLRLHLGAGPSSGASALAAHPPGTQAPSSPEPSQQPQQHQDYHTIASSWQVRRTRIDHYPPEAQLRMRSEWQGRQPTGATAAGEPALPAPAAATAAAAASVPKEATAEAEQLLAALNWESSTGCQNGRGRTGEQFSDWAASRLLHLAAQLPQEQSSMPLVAAAPGGQQPAETMAAAASEPPPQQEQAGGFEAGGLAATCAELAGELGGYDDLDKAGRTLLAQRARLAAEALISEAVQRFRQEQLQFPQEQDRVWGEERGPPLTQQPGSTAAMAAPEEAGAACAAAAEPIAEQISAATAAAAAAPRVEARSGVQGLPGPGPGRPQRQQHPAPPPSADEADLSDDSAAALAHEEETAAPASPAVTEGSPLEGEGVGKTTAAALLAPSLPQLPTPHQQGVEEAEGGAEVTEDAMERHGEQQRRRRRRAAVSPATLGFRQSFAEAAAAFREVSAQPGVSSLSGGEQRSVQWHKLRERRLTASAFSKALGFFEGDREGLWEEKVGLRTPFAGNAATAWGTRSEAPALEDYQLHTGQTIEPCMFQVKHDDMAHGWLGASPDGLIGGLQVAQEASLVGPQGMRGAGVLAGEGPGILEVKCPYNKGQPEAAVPPKHAIWYYMPQVQGLMDIFDREWCNLYVWTPRGGSGLYHIPRDRQYWAECFRVLADFWWRHVVPARQARERSLGITTPGGPLLQALLEGEEPQAGPGVISVGLEEFRPDPVSPATSRLKARSKELAAAAPATFFPTSGPGRS